MSDIIRNPDLPAPNQGVGQVMAYVSAGVLVLLAVVTFVWVWGSSRDPDHPRRMARSSHPVAAEHGNAGPESTSADASVSTQSGSGGGTTSTSTTTTSNPTPGVTTGSQTTGTGTVAGTSGTQSVTPGSTPGTFNGTTGSSENPTTGTASSTNPDGSNSGLSSTGSTGTGSESNGGSTSGAGPNNGGTSSNAGASNSGTASTNSVAVQLAIQAQQHDTADPNGNNNPLVPSGVGPVRNANGTITMSGGGATGIGGIGGMRTH